MQTRQAYVNTISYLTITLPRRLTKPTDRLSVDGWQ